ICGMTLDPATSRHRFAHGDATFHFCCAGCRTKFAADPQKYLAPKEAEPAALGVTFTCPMHPEIRKVGPGSCPICGMALEPMAISANPVANPELADIKQRFWIGLALTTPGFVLEMGGHLSPWLARRGWQCRGILRGGRGHHGPRAAGSGAGTSGSRANRKRDPRA